MIYKLNARLTMLGTFYDPRRGTILATLHLYNAVKQAKILDKIWPDMEYLISLHTPEHLFLGSAPTQRKDFFKIYQLASGLVVMNFAVILASNNMYLQLFATGVQSSCTNAILQEPSTNIPL